MRAFNNNNTQCCHNLNSLAFCIGIAISHNTSEYDVVNKFIMLYDAPIHHHHHTHCTLNTETYYNVFNIQLVQWGHKYMRTSLSLRFTNSQKQNNFHQNTKNSKAA